MDPHLLEKNDRLLEDLFRAYFDARKNKRNTINALRFEKNFERNLFDLFDDIVSRRYKPGKSICFVVDRPVKREIFAADFRDRVVHHFIYNYISPIFEKMFINDTYSCRKGKGVHCGIRRIDHFIRSCSDNYAFDCYVLKLDIKGYFMSIPRDVLFYKIEKTILEKKDKIDFDLPTVLYLLNETIFNDPTRNCVVKGNPGGWKGLPQGKSLFTARPNCGLPIGNLTSQLFGNFYLNEFDHYVRRDLKIERYGRYVDDMILVDKDEGRLRSVIPEIREYLRSNLSLTLHPNKTYLQHFAKGVAFLGAFIKPRRIYIANRVKGKLHASIEKGNRLIAKGWVEKEETRYLLSSLNSYLGTMKHWKTYILRVESIRKNLDGRWMDYVVVGSDWSRIFSRF
ncbi:MAG: RNA-directed DNA polymerase [Candidatus Pacebacteria bacterium]|nr:RNA-directed DNA polymerase [Candidatus Paceibacterota bacterium]